MPAIQDKPAIDVNDAVIHERCGADSNGLPVQVTTEITYIDQDVTSDGIKEKMAKYTEKKWTCPTGYKKYELGIEILRYGESNDPSRSVVKNSKGDSFAVNDVALIGNERFYVIDIPQQSFENIPTPDEIRIILIHEKTLDKIRLLQTSDETVKLQERFVELQKKDPKTVDKEEAQELSKQLQEADKKIMGLVAETVVAKRAGAIEKAGDIPIAKKDKDAFVGTIAALHQEENTTFLKDLIRVAFTNLAKEEVTTGITYIDQDVTDDGIKEKMAKHIETRWVPPNDKKEYERGIEILRYGESNDPSRGVVKNSKGDSFTLGNVALIGSERYYIIAIPGQSFENIPTPDEIRLVLIPEKTLDNIRMSQSSDEFLKLQKKLATLHALYKKDPGAVDKKEAQEVFAQRAKYAKKNNELLATTVVAKRAGDIKKAGDLPIKQEDKDAYMGMLAALRQEENTAFLKDLILIARTNLAKEEVAAD